MFATLNSGQDANTAAIPRTGRLQQEVNKLAYFDVSSFRFTIDSRFAIGLLNRPAKGSGRKGSFVDVLKDLEEKDT